VKARFLLLTALIVHEDDQGGSGAANITSRVA
jgi:hypothetical protein